MHTNQGGDFSRARDEITAGVEGVAWSDEDVAVRRVLVQEQPVYSSPRTDIAPAHFGGNHKDARRPLPAGGRLKDGVVHGNILELRVDDAQLALVVTCSD